MENFITQKGSLAPLLARVEDLRLLLDLESRALSGHRLDVARAITLQSLREFYPGSARRFRDELLMLESDQEALVIFALEYEDREFGNSMGQAECAPSPEKLDAMDRQSSGGRADDPSV